MDWSYYSWMMSAENYSACLDHALKFGIENPYEREEDCMEMPCRVGCPHMNEKFFSEKMHGEVSNFSIFVP